MPGFEQLLPRRLRAADRRAPDAASRGRVRRHQGGRDRSARHFADSVARGRDYYTPYRALLPRGVENLLVAGRHYSATPAAQKISREIPPCMAMGEAAGVAAALALDAGVRVRDVDVRTCRRSCARRAPTPATSRRPNADVPADRRGAMSRRRLASRRPAASTGLPLDGIRVVDFTQVMLGPVLHADARRLRRRRHQGRAQGRGRPVPLDVRAGRGPRQPGLLQPEPQQAQRRARPARGRRRWRWSGR